MPRELLCPYCLQYVTPLAGRNDGATRYNCPRKGCERELPILYVDFPGRREIIAVAGYPSHGKTVYLSVLLWKFLHDSVPYFGSHAYLSPCNEAGLRVLYDNEAQLMRGVLPEANRVCFTEPTMILVENLANYRWNRRWSPRPQSVLLMIYDQSGEIFQPGFNPAEHGLSNEDMARIGRYFSLARSILFLYSPTDVNDADAPDNILTLLNSYRLWVVKQAGAGVTRRQRVVAAYTKADLMLPWLGQYFPDLHNHLADLPYPPDPAYVAHHLSLYSRRLEAVTGQLPGGPPFQAMCAQDFAGVDYALLSALGAPPVRDPAHPTVQRLPNVCTPRCLADPLLLALR